MEGLKEFYKENQLAIVRFLSCYFIFRYCVLYRKIIIKAITRLWRSFSAFVKRIWRNTKAFILSTKYKVFSVVEGFIYKVKKLYQKRKGQVFFLYFM